MQRTLKRYARAYRRQKRKCGKTSSRAIGNWHIRIDNYAIRKGAHDVRRGLVDYAMPLCRTHESIVHFINLSKSETRQSIVIIAFCRPMHYSTTFSISFRQLRAHPIIISSRIIPISLKSRKFGPSIVSLATPMTHANYTLKRFSNDNRFTGKPDTRNYSLNSVQFSTLWWPFCCCSFGCCCA